MHGVGETRVSRQSNRKADEGSKHPDRNAQFEYINSKVIAAQAQQQPVISVDTKKKELVGNFKNGGTDYRPKGDPQRVNVHDFENKKLGKVVPYGVYDVTTNTDSSASNHQQHRRVRRAVDPLLAQRMGRQRYPNARELTVTADCGGSNGARVRLWKLELQKLADETGLVIRVHHYPPGTSKWNKIEHRLFCHITQNWRGRPLTDRLAVVELIGATTTKTGLKVESALDTRSYQKGIKVSKAAMKCLDITADQFHPKIELYNQATAYGKIVAAHYFETPHLRPSSGNGGVEGPGKPFVEKRPKTGRQVGSLNKISKTMKEAVLGAVELLGSTDLDKWEEIIKQAENDPDPYRRFFTIAAVRDLKIFMAVVERMIPTHVIHSKKQRYMTVEAAKAELREAGIPESFIENLPIYSIDDVDPDEVMGMKSPYDDPELDEDGLLDVIPKQEAAE